MPVYYRGYKITYNKHDIVFATTLKNTSYISTKKNPKKVYGISYQAIKRSIREDILLKDSNRLIRMYLKYRKYTTYALNFKKKED